MVKQTVKVIIESASYITVCSKCFLSVYRGPNVAEVFMLILIWLIIGKIDRCACVCVCAYLCRCAYDSL